MKYLLLLALLAWLPRSAAAASAAHQESDKLEDSPSRFRLRPKTRPSSQDPSSLLQPDVDLVDVPTSFVLDYGGYSSRSRFFSSGGVLQYLAFGVFQGLNIGASLNVDNLIGTDTTVRLREPNVQVKYRFYDGDRLLPSLAIGFDGQGYRYNQLAKRYNNRHRGFFLVASQELGLPGLLLHPSVNVSDFDSNSFFGAFGLSYNIHDKVALMTEWDNINKIYESRFNSGLRIYITPGFHLDFAVRGIGQGARYSDGASRGPERIVQLKYSSSF